MTEEKLLDTPYATVIFIADQQLGKIVWHGTPKGDEYQKPFLTLIDWARRGHVVTRFLSDIRKQGIVAPENRKWFENEMVPAAIQHGLKRAAVLTDGNAFKMYYINIILSTVNKFNLPFKLFNDEPKAMAFLLEN